ncbi:MAG TPA: N-acetylglucosamine-6-phosphate deacetylase [Gemmataceae bacterium]
MRIRARHYATGDWTDLEIENGRLVSIGPPCSPAPDRQVGWVAPSLFDLQINGCGGHSFNTELLTVDSIRHVVQACRRHGVGAFCPTLVTNSFEALTHGLTTIRMACDADPDLAKAMPVIHLEGPYLCAEDGPRGAHPKQHIRPPDWNEFQHLQEAAGGRIRLVTLAPELDGAIPFIEKLVREQIVVSLGHTAANGACIHDAIRAGARLSTHLGNGSHALLPRHANYIWEQLAADELWASLICDGHHLPEAVIRCFLRVKTPARTILTCDAGSLAGLPPGRYREWDQEFEVLPEGKIVVPGTSYLAGSWVFTDACVATAMRLGGVSLHDAIDMASARPRELLGLSRRAIAVGEPADLMLFDWEEGESLNVCETLIGSGD